MKLALALLLAIASTSAAATTVTINGTQRNDTIYVGVLQTKNPVTGLWAAVGPRKIVNGVLSLIAPSFTGVTQIDVLARAGNDYVEFVNSTYGSFSISSTQRLAAWNLASISVKIDAGDGDDEVLGSDFNDDIDGGFGDDSLVGAGGADSILGYGFGFASGEDFVGDGLAISKNAGDLDDCTGDVGGYDYVACYPYTYGGPGVGDTCRNAGGGAYPSSCEYTQ